MSTLLKQLVVYTSQNKIRLNPVRYCSKINLFILHICNYYTIVFFSRTEVLFAFHVIYEEMCKISGPGLNIYIII
jgi:hypothetical protein